MAQPTLGPHLKLVAIRACRLNSDCTYTIGANNTIVTAAGIRFNASPEIETGTEILQRQGDGEICLNIKDKDELKRMNVELELCVRDAELVELLTGAPLVLNTGGDTVGYSRLVGAINHPGCSLQIWSRIGSSTGSCVTGTANYVQYFYPKCQFILGDSVFENGLNNLTLTGTIEANPNGLDGAHSDWAGVGNIPATSAESWSVDPAGPPATTGGYVATPANANTP